MKRKITNIWWVLATGLMVLSSCEKEPQGGGDNNGGGNTPETGISLNFGAMWGSNNLEMATFTNTKADKEIVNIGNWKFLVSKLSLIKENGEKVMLGDGYQFVDFYEKRTNFKYVNLPEGNYKGISFVLGVDSLTNHSDPSKWAADHPLNVTLSGLHWGWAGGYIFQAFEGYYKDSATSTNVGGFSYHTAGVQFLRNYTLNYNFSIEKDKVKTAKIEVSADEWFKTPTEINIKTNPISHSSGGKEIILMNKLMDNGADAFSIKEVK